jgi:hypothetical protein
MSERGATVLAGRRSRGISAPPRRSRDNGYSSRPRSSSVEATVRDGGEHQRSFIKAIDKGFGKAWSPWHGQDGDFFEEKTSSEVIRLYHNVQPFGQGRQGYRLRFDGMGFVKVPGAQVSAKEKFFPRGKAFCKAKSSD